MFDDSCQDKKGLVHNRIFIEEEKEFTLDELANFVRRALLSLSTIDVGKDEIVYSRDDVYFSIVDILEFINIRSPGRFKIEQTSFENYIIHYIPDAIQKRRKTKGLTVSKAQSALVIKEQSGELPTWALQNSAIMDAIKDIEDSPKSAPTLQKSVEAREQTDEQIEMLAHEAFRLYEKLGEIPATVTSNIGVLKRFNELLNTEDSDV